MKIAIIDSGVFEGHPHVGQIAGAVQMTTTGLGSDPIDRLGHGTAVAAAIRAKTQADLYSVKVFSSKLAASMEVILRALSWCREQKMDLINLSLGTANAAHRPLFEQALAGNGIVVSAANLLPGSLEGVIAVDVEEDCPRDHFRYRNGTFFASPYPRPIDGVPQARNLQGVSFAVANMTGLIARIGLRGSHAALVDALREHAECCEEVCK